MSTAEELGNELAEQAAYYCHQLREAGMEPKLTYQEPQNRIKIEVQHEKCFLCFDSYKQWNDVFDRFSKKLINMKRGPENEIH